MTKKSDLIELTKTALKQKLESGEGDILVSKDVLKNDISSKTNTIPASTLSLEEFNKSICNCTKCDLHKGRNKFVFGMGNPNADIMFVGEGPGKNEDEVGKPFVGRAGQLLDKILAAIKFDRTQIYIANIVKCRPPNNRDPEPSEMETCLPYLMEQIQIINPEFICCLGRIAAQALLETTLPLGKLRGYFHDWNDRKVLVTYHPAALLRFQQYKRPTWEDVQKLRAAYDEFIAAKRI